MDIPSSKRHSLDLELNGPVSLHPFPELRERADFWGTEVKKKYIEANELVRSFLPSLTQRLLADSCRQCGDVIKVVYS